MQYDIRLVVDNNEALASVPESALSIVAACSRSNSPVSKVIKAIETDVDLTQQLLRIANSNFFEFNQPVFALDRAVVVLGFGRLRELALCIWLFRILKPLRKDAVFHFENYWQHALLTAIIARSIAERQEPGRESMYFAAGLMHDVGKLIAVNEISADYFFLIEQSRQQNSSLHTVEREFLGYEHADISAELMMRWGLPEAIEMMVRFHQNPARYEGGRTHTKRIKRLYLSNLIAHYLRDDLNGLRGIRQLDPEFERFFRFTNTEFDELVNHLRRQIRRNREYFEIY